MRRAESAYEAAAANREGSADPAGRIERILAEIRRWEPAINAYITLDDPEYVVEQAMERPKGRLAGLVVAVKDNISVKGLPATAGSRILEGYMPPYDATVIERIKAEGAIVIGKTNMDEFGMGSTTELSAFGPTRNPWDPTRVPGGSSGGSAAALAYGGADLALGSDTGGSVRLPAAYTGTVGIKPTYGLVSRYGLIPYANSLEQIGPMARSVADAALLLEVMSGWDPRDATTLRVHAPRLSSIEPADPDGVRICIPTDIVEAADDPVRKVFYSLISRLESEGASTEEFKIPWARRALPAYYTIAFAEAASNLARYDGLLYPTPEEGESYEDHARKARTWGFGFEVKRRILMGAFVLSEGYRDEYYLAAARLRRLVRDEMLKITRHCIIATPASPVLPPRLGEAIEDPLKLYALDVYTVLANLAGTPALVQPAGFHGGLPVGVQWIAKPLGESELVALGRLVEELTGLEGVMAG